MNKDSAVFWNSYLRVHVFRTTKSVVYFIYVKDVSSTSELDILALAFLPYIRLNFLR